MKIRLIGPLLFTVTIISAPQIQAQIIDHSHPSANNDDLKANQSYDWGPIFLGGLCRLTDKGSSEAASVFSRERVNVAQFQNSFEFQIHSGGPGDTSNGQGNCSDGLTFTIQNEDPSALGQAGGSLGYAGINHSVAVKFDTVPNQWGATPDPSPSCTGLYTNGEIPMGGTDLLANGVDLRSQHPFRVDMRYDGRVLAVRITDLDTGTTATQSYTVNIPQVIGSRLAHVGFTAATGLGTSAQDLHKWYYASPPLISQRSSKTPSGSVRRVLSAQRSVPARGVTVAAWPAPKYSGARATASRLARLVETLRTP